jgi:hypothetical protein
LTSEAKENFLGARANERKFFVGDNDMEIPLQSRRMLSHFKLRVDSSWRLEVEFEPSNPSSD